MNQSNPLQLVIRTIIASFAIVLSIVLTACGGADIASADIGRFVALGDSSASGPALGPDLAGSPPECARTTGGYPALVAAQVPHDGFANETCSGAMTSSLHTGYTFPGSGSTARAQLDALDGSEKVVLLSIGINNAGFGEVTGNCLFHNQSSANECTQNYVSGGTNALVAKGRSIATDVGKALDSIRGKSGSAEIFLVGYPDLAPTNVSGCSGLLWLTQTDAPVFEQWEVAINDTLRETAKAHGAHFVDAYSASSDHTPCASVAQRWVNPIVGATSGVALHPNATGAAAVAQLVTQAMTASGIHLDPEAKIEPLGFARLHRAARGATFGLKAPVRGGGSFTLALDRPAPIKLTLESLTIGRLVGGKCRVKRRENRSRKSCTRSVPKGDA